MHAQALVEAAARQAELLSGDAAILGQRPVQAQKRSVLVLLGGKVGEAHGPSLANVHGNHLVQGQLQGGAKQGLSVQDAALGVEA
jgi:hypothetical protein